MRLQANFEMNTEWLIKDYRRIFMALIKSTFAHFNPVLLANLYGGMEQKKKVNKPFTFSVHFPKYGKIEGNRLYCGNKASLIFSSNDETLVIALYNGLKKKETVSIGETQPIEFRLETLRLLPFKKITSNKVYFKTISPVLVNEQNNNLVYLSPTHPSFNQAFKFIIAAQANHFGIPCEENMIDFEITTMKKLPLSHYNQTMTTWLGEFVLAAPTPILQLVYDIGIGVRRSQGFGMLEIVKTH